MSLPRQALLKTPPSVAVLIQHRHLPAPDPPIPVPTPHHSARLIPNQTHGRRSRRRLPKRRRILIPSLEVSNPGLVQVLKVPDPNPALARGPQLGVRGCNGSQEAGNLGFSKRVGPELQAGRTTRVDGGADGELEDPCATALGDEFGEERALVLGAGDVVGELAIEELEHVVKTLGGGLNGLGRHGVA